MNAPNVPTLFRTLWPRTSYKHQGVRIDRQSINYTDSTAVIAAINNLQLQENQRVLVVVQGGPPGVISYTASLQIARVLQFEGFQPHALVRTDSSNEGFEDHLDQLEQRCDGCNPPIPHSWMPQAMNSSHGEAELAMAAVPGVIEAIEHETDQPQQNLRDVMLPREFDTMILISYLSLMARRQHIGILRGIETLKRHQADPQIKQVALWHCHNPNRPIPREAYFSELKSFGRQFTRAALDEQIPLHRLFDQSTIHTGTQQQKNDVVTDSIAAFGCPTP